MWFNHQPQQSSRFKRRREHHIMRGFQWKYTFVILGIVVLALAGTLTPLYYFLNQNFNLFIQLAYDHAPQVLDHLEREQRWLLSFGAGAIIAVIFFCLHFGLRASERVARPIWVLENRLKQLSRGNFQAQDIHVRGSDEFHELVEAFNYFQRSMKSATEWELEKLQLLFTKMNDPDAKKLLKDLANRKEAQLGIKPTLQSTPKTSESPRPLPQVS